MAACCVMLCNSNCIVLRTYRRGFSVQLYVVLLVVAIPDVPIVYKLTARDELVVSIEVRVGVLLEKIRRACECKQCKNGGQGGNAR